jgi:hypothetical protein
VTSPRNIAVPGKGEMVNPTPPNPPASSTLFSVETTDGDLKSPRLEAGGRNLGDWIAGCAGDPVLKPVKLITSKENFY